MQPTCFTHIVYIPKWRDAIMDEFNAKNQTWTLVPPSHHHNFVGCKWIFKIKANSSIERSHLVAKGFHQQHGFDYDETFNLVVKPATICMFLCLAVTHGWSICQLDVENGLVCEDVYMVQPRDFVDP